MRLLTSSLIVASAALLSGCGTMASGATQDIKLVTPGAWNAQCTLDNGVRHKVVTGETITVMRSNNDMIVDCYAPGNRHKQMIVKSGGNAWAIGDVATGVVPGVAFDHYAGGLYEYPDVITVDFVGTPTIGFELPDYHNKDAPNPYAQSIEPYTIGAARTVSDNYLRRGVQRRDSSSTNPFAASDAEAAVSAPSKPAVAAAKPATPSGKDAESLTRSANPDVFDPEAK